MLFELILPQLTWICEAGTSEPLVLMVLGGRAPAAEWLRAFLQFNPQAELWAADRGVEACMATGATPRHVVGDFDSAAPEALAWARASGATFHTLEVAKDETDFQAALALVCELRPAARVFATGAFGSDTDTRFDHVMSNVFSLAGYARHEAKLRPVGLGDERERLFFVAGESRAMLRFGKTPHAISLLALTEHCAGVSIEGVAWPLDGVRLELHVPYAISNEVRGECVRVSIKKGILGVYVRQ